MQSWVVLVFASIGRWGRAVMGLAITYMGTKRLLAPVVANIVSDCRDGPLLDAFAGMCAVGQAVGADRQVWNNDIQSFAATVARALFTSSHLPPTLSTTLDIHFPYYAENVKRLNKRFGRFVRQEKEALEKGSFRALQACAQSSESFFARSRHRIFRNLTNHQTANFDLFSIIYGGTYFGWTQCIEIDSIVYAINACVQRKTITAQQREWLIIVLGQAMLRVATTTGHFAQYTAVKPHTAARFTNQRKRSIWTEWSQTLPSISPIHSATWRKKNKVFNEDSLLLLSKFRRRATRPGVVYADPPYTNDQYSRYYHIFETLVLYDYPEVTGHARYRNNRFSTPFSRSRDVKTAFHRLADGCASISADLVLSYPTNGLLHQTGENPREILKQHYRRVETLHQGILQHSTLGASKGAAKNAAVEVIYRAWT